SGDFAVAPDPDDLLLALQTLSADAGALADAIWLVTETGAFHVPVDRPAPGAAGDRDTGQRLLRGVFHLAEVPCRRPAAGARRPRHVGSRLPGREPAPADADRRRPDRGDLRVRRRRRRAVVHVGPCRAARPAAAPRGFRPALRPAARVPGPGAVQPSAGSG